MLVDIIKHTHGITYFELRDVTHREQHGAIFQMGYYYLSFELLLYNSYRHYISVSTHMGYDLSFVYD